MKVLDRVARAEGIEAGEQALDILARAADGSYRDALGLLDQISTYAGGRVEVSDALELIGAVSRESIFELVDLMAGGDAAGAFELLEATLDGPVDPEQAIRGLVSHLRYVCLLQQGARPRDEWAFSPEEVARLQAQANQLPDAQVVRGLDLLADAQVRIRHGGADPRLQMELVAARLSRPALDAERRRARRPRRGPRGRRAAAGRRSRRAAARRGARPSRSPALHPRPSPAGAARPPGPRADPRGPRARAAGLVAGAGHAGARRPAHARAPRRLAAGARSTSAPWPSRSPARCAPTCWGGPSTASGCGSRSRRWPGARSPWSSWPAPRRRADDDQEEAPPLDDDALLAEFKSMFSAVEEGERPERGE